MRIGPLAKGTSGETPWLDLDVAESNETRSQRQESHPDCGKPPRRYDWDIWTDAPARHRQRKRRTRALR